MQIYLRIKIYISEIKRNKREQAIIENHERKKGKEKEEWERERRIMLPQRRNVFGMISLSHASYKKRFVSFVHLKLLPIASYPLGT